MVVVVVFIITTIIRVISGITVVIFVQNIFTKHLLAFPLPPVLGQASLGSAAALLVPDTICGSSCCCCPTQVDGRSN